MTLSELKEKIKKILPVAIPVLVLAGLAVAVGSVFLRPKRQLPETLTRSAATAHSFAWSQDGKRIYYFRSEQGESPLRVLKVEAGSILEDNIVGVGIDKATDVFWSPADSALVLSRLELTGDTVSNVVDFADGDATPVVLGDPVRVYSWSPSGTKLAYITSPDQNNKSNINLFSVGGPGLYGREILGEPLESIEQIFWTSDEKKLFLVARPCMPGEAPVMPELHLFDLEKKEAQLLVAKDKGYFDFVPHASARVLLLSGGGVDLMDAGTKEITAVLETPLHPYGTRCVWVGKEQALCKLVNPRTTSGAKTLWKLDLKTRRRWRIADGVGSFFTASTRGDQLAYLDEEGFIRVTPLLAE